MTSVTIEVAQAQLPELLEKLQPGNHHHRTRQAVGPSEEDRTDLVAV